MVRKIWIINRCTARLAKMWPEVEGEGRQQALSLCIFEGIAATIHIVLTGGKFLIGYLLMLGANSFHLGLVNSLPFFFQSFQFLSGYVMNAVRSRVKSAFWSLVPGRLVWLIPIFLPFLPFTISTKIIIFIGVYAFFNILMVIGSNAWLLWFDDVMPMQIRGRFIATRGAVLLIVTIIIDLAGSWLLEAFKSLGHEATGFSFLFFFACVFAALGGWFMLRQWEPPFTSESMVHPLTVIRSLKTERTFARLIKFFAIWNVAIGIPSAFWSAHMLTNLHMTYSDIWKYTCITGLAGFAASLVWGRLIDKTGSKPVMTLTGIIICTFPIIWFLPTAENWSYLYFEAILNGVCWVGFNTAAFNLPLVLAPRSARPQYIALFATTSGASFGAASITGGLIAYVLHNFNVTLLGRTFVNFHLLFLISSSLRIIALFRLRKIKEEKGASVGYLMQEIGMGVQKARYFGKQVVLFPYHWVRKL